MHRFLSKEMNKGQFVKLAVSSGYSNKAGAEEYVKENPKDKYTTDDFIALHNKSMHWSGVSSDLGLRSIYGLNGKTTAKRNGVQGMSGSGQDWRY